MRCLDTVTCQFVDVDPSNEEYAILSHTWDRGGEQTYQDLRKIQGTFQELKKLQERYSSDGGGSLASVGAPNPDDRASLPCLQFVVIPNPYPNLSSAQLEAIARNYPIWNDRDLSPKIRHACAVARKYGFRLIWIDSCCIDKTSSSELSEAINSMFAWYTSAQVCFAYLVDVDPGDNPSAKNSQFRGSIWFKRGWTLQELIAPYELIMFSKDWRVMGSKRDLADVIEQITSISADALLHEKSLCHFSVAQRFSWASYRQTTRVEDRAYSLLGIFDINIPTLYGEGERAFRRLQEAIMDRIPDQTLFAWGSICEHPDVESLLIAKQCGRSPSFECFETIPGTSILAPSPIDFAGAGSITAVSHEAFYNRVKISPPEYTSTPHGIRTQLPVVRLDLYLPPSTATAFRSKYSLSEWYLVILACQSSRHLDSLLGSVCYIPSSESGLNLLYCGMIRINQQVSNRASFEPRRSCSANLFPFSSATIERCRHGIELKVVYITRTSSAVLDWTVQAAVTATSIPSRPSLKTVYLNLTRKARGLLCTNGYDVISIEPRDPLSGEHPSATYWIVTLSGKAHTITAEYRYFQSDLGFLITKRNNLYSSPQGPDAVSRSNRSWHCSWDDPGPDGFLAYNSPPTKALLPQEVCLAPSDPNSSRMVFKLNFERWSSFTLDVDITPPPQVESHFSPLRIEFSSVLSVSSDIE